MSSLCPWITKHNRFLRCILLTLFSPSNAFLSDMIQSTTPPLNFNLHAYSGNYLEAGTGAASDGRFVY